MAAVHKALNYKKDSISKKKIFFKPENKTLTTLRFNRPYDKNASPYDR